jgi:hypothetical protein
MGLVEMTSVASGFSDGGSPGSEAVSFMYCDRCGSFSIKYHIALSKKILLVSASVVVLVAILHIQPTWNCVLAALACLPLALIVLPAIDWRNWLLGEQCRKCGNARITCENPLRYEPNDSSVVDVEERLIMKVYPFEYDQST